MANKLCFPFANKICVTFPETANYFKNKDKVIVTGTPIRNEFFHGDPAEGRKLCNFFGDKKIILVYGGSLGAENINIVIRQLLPKILLEYQIVHVCGKGKVDKECQYEGYKQFEYLDAEFPHIIAAADIVVARSGANSIYELLILRKPHILIPLSKSFSRGDQIENAKYCAARGYSQVIFPEELNSDKLYEKINFLAANSDKVVRKLATFARKDSVNIIYDLLAK